MMQATLRAMPALLLLSAFLASGCSQSQDQTAATSRETTSAKAPGDAPASESNSEPNSEPSAAAPPQRIFEEPPAPSYAPASANAARANESTSDLPREPASERASEPRAASQNSDSSLLHPQQVKVQSRSKSAAARSIRSLAGPSITAAARTPAPAASAMATAAPEKTFAIEAENNNLPAISMHECELFHNHRDGAANEVTILYGTDRDRVDHTPVWNKLWAGLCSSLAGSLLVTGGLGMTAFFAARKKLLIFGALSSGLFSVFLGYPIVADLSVTRVLCSERKPGYGVGRGELEVGVCHVSVPPIHNPGSVESPSILSLDVIPDPERHFLLEEVEPLSQEPFYTELRRQVARSPKKDLFVFIHGYNVSFEAAALRTAQMKSDLEFAGAACFYSWPSQGGLLQYTRDEENVRYTITHLRQFLTVITQQSGAESIHLIAHSMGNRAVTDVLKELRLELGKDKSKLFNQIILAAPDVDAQVFMNELAPRIKDTADRVTLYASSNDRALIASKIVHGYPRAGESGRGMVIVDGVQTVDVSGVDSSLLGHSYYGDSASVLTDLAFVLRGKKPVLERSWLTPEEAQGLTFWRFSAQEFETAKRLAKQLR